MDILVIGDSHAKPGVDNKRFTRLGKVIVDLLPDIIINMGDFFDFPSLSSFDVGKKSFEGRRYRADLEAGWDALKRINEPINEYNLSLKAKKVKQYSPKMYALGGNHCQRIVKAVNSDPKLEGTMGLEDLKFEEFGWEFIPFLNPLLVAGITFQHYFVSGSLDRSISSENTGRAILKKYHSSCLAGHSHKLDLAWEANAKGDLMMAGTVGCYFEHEEEWQSLQAQKHFWRGLVYLKDVKDGVVNDLELISMETIKKKYK